MLRALWSVEERNGLGCRECLAPSLQYRTVSGLDFLNLLNANFRNCNLWALLRLSFLALRFSSLLALVLCGIALVLWSFLLWAALVVVGLALLWIHSAVVILSLGGIASWLLRASLLQKDNYKLSINALRAFALSLCLCASLCGITLVLWSFLLLRAALVVISLALLWIHSAIVILSLCRIALWLRFLALRLLRSGGDVLVRYEHVLDFLSLDLESVCSNALCRNCLCILYYNCCRLSVRTCNKGGYALRLC